MALLPSHINLRQNKILHVIILPLFYLSLILVLVDITLLSLFIPTFFIVSLTPGMCMTLAMTLGMTIGVKKTSWMMLGELLGVAIVAIAAVLGVATIMMQYPTLFSIFKLGGAAYLIYIGVNMWRAKGKLAINTEQQNGAIETSRKALFNQGLVTAIANPKGWAFMVSLLPPFINTEYKLAPQLTLLILIILMSELVCMTLYAAGGRTIGKILTKQNNVALLNKISGVLMMLVGCWLALS